MEFVLSEHIFIVVVLMWLSPEFSSKVDRHLQASIQKTCQYDGSRGQFCDMSYCSDQTLVSFVSELVHKKAKPDNF